MHAARMAAEALARGDDAKHRYWLRIQRQVDRAPPLTNAQLDRLVVLLRGAQHPVKSIAAPEATRKAA